MLEVRLDLPKQVCSVWPQRVPSVSPSDRGAAAQEARRSEVPPWGAEATACDDAAEPLISMTRLASPIPRPDRSIALFVLLPLLPSVFTFPRVWLSLCPPLPSVTDNLEVNQRTFAKDRLVVTPSCEDGWLGG